MFRQGREAGAQPGRSSAPRACARPSANDYVVYNKATGNLFYDFNGNARRRCGASTLLTTKPTLTASDFVVIRSDITKPDNAIHSTRYVAFFALADQTCISETGRFFHEPEGAGQPLRSLAGHWQGAVEVHRVAMLHRGPGNSGSSKLVLGQRTVRHDCPDRLACGGDRNRAGSGPATDVVVNKLLQTQTLVFRHGGLHSAHRRRYQSASPRGRNIE